MSSLSDSVFFLCISKLTKRRKITQCAFIYIGFIRHAKHCGLFAMSLSFCVLLSHHLRQVVSVSVCVCMGVCTQIMLVPLLYWLSVCLMDFLMEKGCGPNLT